MLEKEDLSRLAELLLDFVTDESPEAQAQAEALAENDSESVLDMLADSLAAFETSAEGGVSPEDLQRAIEQLSADMTSQQQAQLEPLRDAINSQEPTVIQEIIQQHAAPITNVQHVTRVTNVTKIDEGDQFVDQSVNTTILAEGDVEFDQEVSNTANIADDGAVVVGGDLEDSAVNTGEFDGVQAAGDIDIENSAIGDANVLVADSEFDALAIGGDATSVEAGGDANVGDNAVQVGIEAEGDAQAVIGSENNLALDQTANVNTAPAADPFVEEPVFDDPPEPQNIDVEPDVVDLVEEEPIELDA